MIKIHDNLGAFCALGPTEKAFFFLVPVSNFMHMGGVWGVCTGIDIQIYWCGYYVKLHVQGWVWYIIYDSRIVVADVKRNRFYAGNMPQNNKIALSAICRIVRSR